jgi:hypothetical protein
VRKFQEAQAILIQSQSASVKESEYHGNSNFPHHSYSRAGTRMSKFPAYTSNDRGSSIHSLATSPLNDGGLTMTKDQVFTLFALVDRMSKVAKPFLGKGSMNKETDDPSFDGLFNTFVENNPENNPGFLPLRDDYERGAGSGFEPIRRPVFCRLILDMGLVADNMCRYSSIVQEFDERAIPLTPFGEMVLDRKGMTELMTLLIRRNYTSEGDVPRFDKYLNQAMDRCYDRYEKLNPTLDDTTTWKSLYIRNMMIEPEVIHTLVMYDAFFRTLFNAYVDEEGHLPWERFETFLHDMELIPKCGSAYNFEIM